MDYTYKNMKKRAHKKFSEQEHVEIWKLMGKLLADARKENEFSQQQVAQTGIIGQTTLSKIERGQRGIDIITLTELASLYDMDVEELLPEILKNCNQDLEEAG